MGKFEFSYHLWASKKIERTSKKFLSGQKLYEKKTSLTWSFGMGRYFSCVLKTRQTLSALKVETWDKVIIFFYYSSSPVDFFPVAAEFSGSLLGCKLYIYMIVKLKTNTFTSILPIHLRYKLVKMSLWNDRNA